MNMDFEHFWYLYITKILFYMNLIIFLRNLIHDTFERLRN